MAASFRIIGTMVTVRKPLAMKFRGPMANSGRTSARSAISTILQSRMAAPCICSRERVREPAPPRLGWRRIRLREGDGPDMIAAESAMLIAALGSRCEAFVRIESNTGWCPKRAADDPKHLRAGGLLLPGLGEFRACAPEPLRIVVTFSMAITAWSANVSSSAICFSENGRASVIPTTIRDDRAVPQKGHAERRQ